jgi:site-specific DNA recombinase
VTNVARMIAAIYARKSTDQSGVADESKSVTRQVEHARQYAKSKGWSIDEAAIFVDDGISGAEFDRRPGFVRLMATVARKRATFDVLIMSESSRLGREAWETGFALKRILKAGVRVFFYLEDRECTVESPTDKLMFSVLQGVDEMHRALASQRSIDKALQLARAGHVTGGRVFGYDNVRVGSHTERQINENESAVVRRIFELAAAGHGQKRIAQMLNADRALTPRAQQDRPSAWAVSSVHAVLFRDLYRGSIVWNRTRKRNRWGEKHQADRPADDWLTTAAPQLRIISDELWRAAHTRIVAARALYRDATKGLRGGRPRIESKYLLTGLARCALCNGGIHVRTSNHGSADRRWRVYAYACSSYQNRGPTVCRNDFRISMQAVDAAVLSSIGEILTTDLVDEVIVTVRELLEPGGRHDPRVELDTDLATLEQQLSNLTEAIAMGGNLPALLARLKQAEDQRQRLLRQRDELPAASAYRMLDWRLMERQAREKLASWRTLATRHPAEGRQLLRELLVDGSPVRLTPIENGRQRGFSFEGIAYVGGLFEGLAFTNGNWRPHRDSNPGFSLERAAS